MYGIVTYQNGQWAIFVTGGQLKKRHIPTPEDVIALEQLGAKGLEGTPWTTEFLATLPTVP